MDYDERAAGGRIRVQLPSLNSRRDGIRRFFEAGLLVVVGPSFQQFRGFSNRLVTLRSTTRNLSVLRVPIAHQRILLVRLRRQSHVLLHREIPVDALRSR